MRPKNLSTKIFLDGGDPAETKEALQILGFLDGQTTNPTLIAKNPEAKARLERGEKFSPEEIYDFYKNVVGEIAKMIPQGSVSIEVYADKKTTAEQMFQQGQEMFTWIPNAHVKYPTTATGLEVAEKSITAGMRVNMTLCFTQQQTAAVYAATKGAKKGDVFVSPFVGRLDDRGENGMSLIANCMQMLEKGDGHVEILTASVRNMEHFLSALQLKSHIITAPAAVLKDWAAKSMPLPDATYHYETGDKKDYTFLNLDLNQNWRSFPIEHELTDTGIERFANDWNQLIS